ncbi:MAG: ATP-binding protein [Thermomicrobiales bacterium]
MATVPMPDHARASLIPLTFPWNQGQSAPLPVPLTSLVGRERDVALALALLDRHDVRLLTLTGSGGIGKTRLALQIAANLAGAFADGVRFVSLATILDPGLVATTIARSLGIQPAGDAIVRDALVAALGDRQALLVFDNFEQVLTAAPLLTDLLTFCPHLKMLVTSRTLLRVGGEHALPVPPLDLPAQHTIPSLENLKQFAAVQLFAHRASAVASDFALTETTASLVADICQRLDGLPLAIELAAAQSVVLPPAALLARIQARLPLPGAGLLDAPDRQRTMHDTVAWSYDLLSDEEQTLFRRVGIFVGGFSLDAADFVSGGQESGARGQGEHAAPSPTPDSRFLTPTLDLLASLVDKSLLRQAAWEGEPRFTMLETIRAFAVEQLVARDEFDAVSDAHAGWCLDLAERSELARRLPAGERQLRRLEADHANLRTALDWLDRRGDAERLLRLAAALGGFWHAHSHYREGRIWLERALAVETQASDDLRARALVELGGLLALQSETDRAEQILTESVAVLREYGDAAAAAIALIRLGGIADHRGHYSQAERLLEEALSQAAAIQDSEYAAIVTGWALANLGVAAQGQGRFDVARMRHEESLQICREHGYLLGVIRSLRDLGDLARDQGDFGGSVAFYRECLSLLGEHGDVRVVVDVLEGSARAAAAWHQPEQAARLLGAAEALREEIGAAFIVPTDRAAHERTVAIIRASLGEHGLQAAWSIGRGRGLASAIAEMQAMSSPAVADVAVDHAGITLSPREHEILRLLTAGQTDREIADALFISVRTVEHHVARILRKLGVRTRTAAVRAAIAASLVDPSPSTSD